MPNKTKTDLLAGCLDDLRSKTDKPVKAEDVEDVFCDRCRNQSCVRAGQGRTKWLHRMETQVDRLFHSPVADPDSPLAKELAEKEFKDMTHKAMQLIVSSQKGDWSVPTEGEILEAQGIMHRPQGFEAGESGAQTEVILPPDSINPDNPYDPYDFSDGDEGEDEPEEPEEEPTKVAPKVSKGFHKPSKPNVSRRSGIMIGEESMPEDLDGGNSDPWAPPAKKKKDKVTKIEPGGTFTFSARLHEDKDGDDD